MNRGYGYNNDRSKRCPIEYVCKDCSFSTFDKDEEEEHYAGGHYLSSKVRADLEEDNPDF